MATSLEPTQPPADPLTRALAAIRRSRAALELDTTMLCFLVALRSRADRSSLASFDEDVLFDVFEQVLEQTEPEAPNPRKRTTHAIQRLREQRLLVRVDAAGVLRAGEFALTRLANGIVDFFLADETLTRESLGLLTKSLVAQLTDIRRDARKAGPDAAAWVSDVVGPLRVTVGDLLHGIDRRQRGMDAQQEEVVQEIEQLLRNNWFEAVDACEALLERTSTTLRELNEVLLQDSTHLLALLQELEQLATKAHQQAAVEAVRSSTEHVDRVVEWGNARLRTWSGYYQHVHGFLRDVVRLDPERAISQRLRDRIAGWIDQPYALFVADGPSIRLLRERVETIQRPPVTRPREDRDIGFHEGPPRTDDLAALVDTALEQGATTLSEVLARVLGHLTEAERYRAVGRVAELVAAARRVRAQVAPPWVSTEAGISVEEWELLLDAASRRARRAT